MAQSWEAWLTKNLARSGTVKQLIHVGANRWQEPLGKVTQLNDHEEKIHARLMHTLTWCKQHQCSHEFSSVLFTPNGKLFSMCIYNFTVTADTQQQWSVTITRSDKKQLLDAADLFDNPILNSLNDAVVLTDTRPVNCLGPRIITTNKASRNMTGYSLPELIGHNPNILQGNQGKTAETQKIKRALARWQPVVATVKNFRKDGTPFYVELNIVPFKDKSGWYSHWVSVQRDLSSRLEQVAMIKQHEMLLSSPYIGCWSYNSQAGKVSLDKNTQDMHFLGSVPAVSLEAFLTYVCRSEKAQVIQRFQAALSSGKSVNLEYQVERNGEVKWILTKAHQADSGQHGIIVSGISFDITQEKQTSAVLNEYRAHAEQRNRLASIGELSAGVGHEINNPLSIITSTVDYLRLRETKNQQYDSELRQCLTDISHASERIERIVDGLKSISSGARSADKVSQINLIECCTPTLEMSQQLFEKEGIALTINWPANPAAFLVLGETSGLQQVLVNLLNNSRDAVQDTAEQSITVSFTCNDATASMIVSDTGVGISPDLMERIFEPFVTTKLVAQGTGLGLSISKNIIHSFGGSLYCHSAANRTTRFFCELPKAKGQQAPEAQAHEHASGDAAVLIVENEQVLANAIKRLFELNGCACQVALNGNAALEAIEHQHFDIIISAVEMPGLDGFELLERLAQDTRFLDVKKFAMTGESLTANNEMMQALAENTLAVFQKPIKLIDIAKMVDIAKTTGL